MGEALICNLSLSFIKSRLVPKSGIFYCLKMSERNYKSFTPKVSTSAFVADTAVIIGDVEIGEDSSVWYGCTIRGDVNDVKIGKCTNIQDGSVIHVSSTSQGTYIGDEVTVGHMALLHACTVQDKAFIGMKACIMDDVLIEKGAMIGAGALVTPGKTVPSGQLWAGVPARYIRDLSDEEKEFLDVSARRYVTLSREYINNER